MPVLTAKQLATLSADIFRAAGAQPEEAKTVADALVEANLEGHDSHGVVRVPEYVEWMEQKHINIGAHMSVVRDAGGFAVLDGNWGWGQVVAKEAMEYGIKKALSAGSATISVSQCCHIGRVGDYPLMAAKAGLVAVMFVNTHGGGRLVAPWGGRERRLSANPISVAIPRNNAAPILMDLSTCAIAGGKVTIAYNSGKKIPPGCLIDAEGRPSTDPKDFVEAPEGALLPFGGHKGFALSLAADILAGALSGAGCSRPGVERIGNSFTATLLDPGAVRGRSAFDHEVDQFVEYVKSSKLADGFDEIMVPGEPEQRERAKRETNGIPVDEVTWGEIRETAEKYGVKVV